MRENLKANDADIYSTSVSSGKPTHTDTPDTADAYDSAVNQARDFAEALTMTNEIETKSIKAPERPSRNEARKKITWLGGASLSDQKKKELEPLPRSWQEKQQIKEDKRKSEKEAASATKEQEEKPSPTVENDTPQVEKTEETPAEDMVSREEYEKLEKRVEVLTHDYEMLKTRQKAEMEENKANANMNIAKTLIPIFDDLDKAIEYSQQNSLDTMDLDGIIKIRKKLSNVLGMEGLLVINPLGEPFDMNEHQAIERDHTDGPEDIVTTVYQVGYKMNGRIIRPALVAVSCN